MEAPFLIAVIAAMLALSGCIENQPEGKTGIMEVKLLQNIPPSSIEWQEIPAEERPEELPELFDEAKLDASGLSTTELTAERVEEIGVTLSKWSGDAKSSSYIIEYQNSYYEVVLVVVV